jgi:hypothetical protein
MHGFRRTGRACWSKKDVSNWINSGGHAPRLQTRECETGYRENASRRRARPLNSPIKIAAASLLVAVAAQVGHARDRGQFAGSSPELRAWFEGLRSGRGPCCSDADGTAISDADWESKGGHYRVRIDDQWIDVPEEAVITEPNRVGRTMVWPIRGYLGLTIRCFMPGSMT